MIAHNGVDDSSDLSLRIESLLEELYLIPVEEVVRRLKQLVPEYKAGRKKR